MNKYTFAGLNFSSANFTACELNFFCGFTIYFSHKNSSAEGKWWGKGTAKGAYKNVLKLHSGRSNRVFISVVGSIKLEVVSTTFIVLH